MKRPDQKIRWMVLPVLLCGSLQVRGYTNPIDSQATATITNLWDLGSESLQVGLTTSGNTLIVTNGGRVESSGGILGSSNDPFSYDNRVVVTGTGSAWINSGEVRLNSNHNELFITDGGRVENGTGWVGGYQGSSNRVIVSGSGSIWSNSATLSVAGLTLACNNSEVIVTNGGYLYSNGGAIGDQGNTETCLTVSGSGSVWKNAGSVDVRSGAELLISDGGRVENTDARLFNNSGTTPARVTGIGSEWINSGHLNIHNAHLVISAGGLVQSGSGSAIGSSTITVTGAGSSWVNFGALDVHDTSSATVSSGGTISSAALALAAGSAFHLQTGGTLAVSGDFDANPSGTFDFAGGTLSVGGNLTNLSILVADCRLEAVDISGDLTVYGTFAPRQSPADTLLDGAFVLTNDGTLEMELTGYLPGAEYDRLTVTDLSTLDGTLAILLLDGFSPVYGSTFDLFNWDGDVSGTFAVTNLPSLSGDLFWDTNSLYTDGTLTVVPEPSTFLLLGAGLAAFGIASIRKKVYEF
jgi:T5SS/PEP-CTERM-associated repeat protein